MKIVNDLDPRGKKVLVRVDWNVTLGKALQIVDDTRIVRTLPTIRYLLEKGAAQVILMSHLGKPEGVDPHFSLAPVVRYASRLLHTSITLVPSYDQIPEDRVVMLENLRFHEGEEKNDPLFTGLLSRIGDMYVNEAFGEAHRESASIVGLPRLLPHYAGLWFVEEVDTILRVRDSASRPFVVVMGGAKVDDKIKLLEILSHKADTILLGGKLANEFVIRGMKLSGTARVVLPTEGTDILDIGVQTQKVFSDEISRAQTIVWNGPMGKVEDEKYRAGTHAVYDALVVNETAYTVVGGGDTLAAIGKDEHITRIDHVSTGGGAMLKLLEAGTLPGIRALTET